MGPVFTAFLLSEKAVNTGPVISSANEKIWPIYGKKILQKNIYF